MLTKIGVGAAPPDMRNAFWPQQELGVVDPADEPVEITQVSLSGGGIQFTAGGEVVARYIASDKALPPSEQKGFTRFLYANASLHPKIIDAVLASGMVPKEIFFVNMLGGKRRSVQWELISTEHLNAPYPLPLDYASKILGHGELDAESQPLANILPLMLDAVAQRASGLRNLSDYGGQITDALGRKAHFAVFLTFLEVSLQYGQEAALCSSGRSTGCLDRSTLTDAVKSDPRSAALSGALAVEKSDLGKAVAMEQGIDRSGVSNGYVLDDFIGNTLVEAVRGSEAVPFLSKAIQGNPYIAGYYKDFGDLFRESFRADLAWVFYDLGRTLPGGPNAPVISRINEYEEFLEKKCPQFF